jgi:competence protein ComFC
MNYLSQVAHWTVDTLFPKYCVGCNAPDTFLCQECFDKIILVKQQQCGRCLKISANGKTCQKCKQVWTLDNLLVAAYYQDGPVKELIHAFKYEGNRILKHDLIHTLQKNNAIYDSINKIKRHTIVVPVPLHFRRKWWRGFNQSEEIAKLISKELNLTMLKTALKRKHHTKIQASLHRKDRLNNLIEAFEAKTCLNTNSSVILVDDIATTGATLNACAIALKKAGFKRVVGVVIARAF